MSHDTVLDRLVESPKLGMYVQRLSGLLAEERQRREQFYHDMKEGEKQEFINGKTIMPSPVTNKHERASSLLYRLLSTYVDLHQLGRVGHEKLLISLTRNDYEPDVCFFRSEKARAFIPTQMKFPAPDFISEVLSESTEAIDRGVKFEDYAAHGVGEYWMVDPDRELVEQFVLQGECYQLRLKMNAGILQSGVITGLELPVRAIFDEHENLAVLRRMLGRA